MQNQIENKEELEIIKMVENDEFISLVDNEFDDLKNSLKIASLNTNKQLSKKQYINIELLENDILKLKKMALKEGMSYQIYLTHIIHNLTKGKLQIVS